MDADSETMSVDVPVPIAHESHFFLGHSTQAAVCTLCRRSPASDIEAMDDLVAVSLCGDCKFLLLEDLATPSPDVHRRSTSRRRRRNRQSSSESNENLFSQQFSLMINLMRQNQSAVTELEDHSLDTELIASSLQHTSSRTTPSSSTGWRRVLSDTESDGYENVDYFYGDSESSISFGQYRGVQGESDAVSFSNYGGDTDASVDGHSLMDTELFINPENRSDFDSDTDIDPMHTGLSQWNWDDAEEDEGEEDGEWEEADAEEDSVQFTVSRAGLQDLFIPSPSERNFPIVSSPINFQHARGFERLLDHLAETDSSRRGAPPASISFVSSLPHVLVGEEHEKNESVACAICKDILPVGTEVSQLPCLHIYHPSCILPWLSTRNSCPLCRYELPTDDKDYEEGKRHANSTVSIPQIQEQDVGDGSSSSHSSDAESEEAHETNAYRSESGQVHSAHPTMNNSSRESSRDWLFRAAAPIVGIVGMALVLWLGKPLIVRSGSQSQCSVSALGQHQMQGPSHLNLNQRGNRGRRWWFLF